MQHNTTDILWELLTITNYPNNKHKFIAEFEEVNQMEAIANLLERLPEELQEKVKLETESEAIKKYITNEEYQREITNVSVLALERFIQSISPSLSLEQKEKVVRLISTI